MALYDYTAADRSGKLRHGQMEAGDRQLVISYLKSEGLFVVSVKEKVTGFGRSIRVGVSKRITLTDKINFTSNLATMAKAGISLTEALDIMTEEAENPRLRLLLSDLKFAIENGKPLSDGLQKYSHDFDEIFINMIRAGEASGKLEDSLIRLNIQLKKDYALISKVKGAVIYPAVLICGTLGVLILIITFVIPRLATVFSESDFKIPLTTRIIFFIARVSSFNPILTLVVVSILAVFTIILARRRWVRTAFKKLFLRLPVTSNLLRQMEQVRFCRITGGLLSSGIAIGKTLEITASGMSMPEYRKSILAAKEKILKGVSLANAFRGQEKLFSRLLISVINVGEKTGNLDQLLGELANFYEEQTDNTFKTLASLVEPALLVIVGFLIGGMAVSIIVPIYQLIGQI